jgi:hypothetical protein
MSFNPALDTANILVDLETALGYLGVPVTDGDRIPMVKQCINGASNYCNTHTGRKLLSRALTEYYDGRGENTILLNNYPCTTLTSVYDDLARAYGAGTLVAASDLAVMPTDLLCMIVYDGSVFMPGVKNVKITYTAGYLTVPWDLQQACLGLIGIYFKHTDEKTLSIASRNVGDGNITIESNRTPQWIIDILNAYKKKW